MSRGQASSVTMGTIWRAAGLPMRLEAAAARRLVIHCLAITLAKHFRIVVLNRLHMWLELNLSQRKFLLVLRCRFAKRVFAMPPTPCPR